MQERTWQENEYHEVAHISGCGIKVPSKIRTFREYTSDNPEEIYEMAKTDMDGYCVNVMPARAWVVCYLRATFGEYVVRLGRVCN